MSRITKLRAIVTELSSRDAPISNAELGGIVGAQTAGVRRVIAQLRDEFGAPITSTRRGYAWRPAPWQYEHAKALVTVFGVKS